MGLPRYWKCRFCGEEHDTPPLCFGADAPSLWHLLSTKELADSQLDKSWCYINAKHEQAFFVRGHIDILILGTDEAFTWSVWASLSEKKFARKMELWNSDGRENEPPYFGWLCSSIEVFPDTMYLKTSIQERAGDAVPLVTVEPTDHPLAVAQHGGVTMETVTHWLEQLLH